MDRMALEAELRSFGVDLLSLAERYGVNHIDVFALTKDDEGEPYVNGMAWVGDEKVAGTDWFIEEDAND